MAEKQVAPKLEGHSLDHHRFPHEASHIVLLILILLLVLLLSLTFVR